MTQFLGDISGMMEIFAIALGLVLLHRAKSESNADLLRAAGWLLVCGGVIIGACTLYYWFMFRSHGMMDYSNPMNGTYMDGGRIAEPRQQ